MKSPSTADKVSVLALDKEDVRLRQEEPSDYRMVEELTREAFWNRHVPD